MPGAGTVYSQKAVYDVGGWPDLMNEDVAMSYQILQKGYDTLWTNLTHCMQRECLNVISAKKRWERILFGTHALNKVKTNKANNLGSFVCWMKLAYYLSPIFFGLMVLNQLLLVFVSNVDSRNLVLQYSMYANLCFLVPILICLLIVLIKLNYSFVKKNVSYVFFGLIQIVCFAPVMLLKLYKTFFNLFVLRKKSIGFSITNKRKVNMNSRLWNHIIVDLLLMGVIIGMYIAFSYLFNLWFQLIPFASTILYFPFAMCILNIISMLKTKTYYDSQKTVEGISLF
jgi:hypothetical protein